MDTQANKERKFTQAMEKWIMYFVYALFGGLFFLISLQGSWSEGLILFPIAIISPVSYTHLTLPTSVPV